MHQCPARQRLSKPVLAEPNAQEQQGKPPHHGLESLRCGGKTGTFEECGPVVPGNACPHRQQVGHVGGGECQRNSMACEVGCPKGTVNHGGHTGRKHHEAHPIKAEQ